MVEPAHHLPHRLDVKVRKATRADVPALEDVLTRAFESDPLMSWIVRQDEARLVHLKSYMSFALRVATMPYGDVYTTGGLHGAALWSPPGKWKLGPLQQLRGLPGLARGIGLRRVPTVIPALNVIHRLHPQQSHYYLGVLGVDPDYQGLGIGTQLMAPVLQRCDRGGIPAYLESSRHQNVPLYEANGFHVVNEVDLPKGGPRVWLMWRDPR